MRWSRFAVALSTAMYAASLCSVAAAPSDAFTTPDAVIKEITVCLQQGREIFMGANGAECVDRNEGAKKRKPDMPFGIVDPRASCRNESEQRRLSGDVVKRVIQYAANSGQPIAPSGIRIIGAIVCGNLDIAGLDLPYSLVLDNSAFSAWVYGRNFKIRGDLSFDGSFLPDRLILTRSRVEGSFYARSSVIRRQVISDTHIQGSWHQYFSIVFGNIAFHGTTLSGDLYLSGSALSMLSLNSSRIQGGLDLTGSETRCGYHVRWNEIGFVFAEDVGFGAIIPANQIAPGPDRDSQPPLELAWWSRLKDGTSWVKFAAHPALQPLVAAEIEAARNAEVKRDREIKRLRDSGRAVQVRPQLAGCAHLNDSENAEFYFLNNRIQTNLCLRSFSWLGRPGAQPPTTILSLNGSSASGSLIVDLSGAASRNAENQPCRSLGKNANQCRRFEAIGISTGSLIFNFPDSPPDYVTYLDGLKFNQVHTATVTCTFQRVSAEGASDTAGFSGGIIRQPSLPREQDVKRWLATNGTRSSQPLTAFITAFENSGADATDLRVARKSADLCEATAQWLRRIKCPTLSATKTDARSADLCVRAAQWVQGKWLIPPRCPLEPGVASLRGDVASARDGVRGGFFDATAEFVSIAFQWSLYYLADHGIRPGLVVWWLIGVLLAFFFIFWIFPLRIRGFEPKASKDKEAAAALVAPKPWPISFLFLFDRLIPVYKIREEHHEVTRYFRRATRAERRAAEQDPAHPVYPMRYFRMTWWVRPATDAEKQRAERYVIVLRIIGAALAVFLAAAISALTR